MLYNTACLKKCSTCDNGTECTACTGADRSNTLPSCPCNTGFYDDPTQADC